ncbi:inosine guanosine and [Ascodesmis nigricans]|uniref:Purine nucleoside phosphorylase n=1 Tax=Ascodesmis nigricans TaxID=341454 RepID=A0A4S2N743_9PEZI|nr:inosine guanosine and [Ascodesmis nigricans]
MTAEATIFDEATKSADFIRSQLPQELQNPVLGIICGSGLGGLADTLHAEPAPRKAIGYEDIPGFPVSRVPGHAGKLAFGYLGEKKTPVVIMSGRAHIERSTYVHSFYEGHSMQTAVFPTRVMKLLGIKSIIVTNAAGGLNPEFNVGDIMIINDHINFPGLAGNHPLRGPNEDSFGTRFPALSDAYDLSYRRTAHSAFKSLTATSSSRAIREGVYAFVSGPTFETRAECRMLRTMGADVVGMSTVPEICVARHMGLRVLAFSLVTNCAVLQPGPRGDDLTLEGKEGKDINKVMEVGKAEHEEVLEAGRDAAKTLQDLVTSFVDVISGQSE